MRRRQFLQALGVGAGGLLLPSGRATGAATPAKRVVFFITSHGTVYDQWRIRMGQPDTLDYVLDLESLAEADVSPILAPLMPHASKLLVLDGLANGCVVSSTFNEHEEGHASLLTGKIPMYVPGGLGRPDGPSLDQVIGAERNTPFPSLEWATGEAMSVNFDAGGQPLPYGFDPLAAWDRLFPAGLPEAEAPSTAARIRARQHSVLDLAAQRYEALAPRLSGEDRVKLSQHRDLVRDLETRIQTLAELVCEAPPTPEWPSEAYTDADFPNQMASRWFDLTVGALACGLTDVVTLRLDHINNNTLNAPPGDIHNDYAHQAYSGDTEAGRIMTDYAVWQAERFAELLARLDAVPEGYGSLLDHTVVVWMNELATGTHGFRDIPVVMAGGTEFFDTGRYVRWQPTHHLSGHYGGTEIGPPHNRLLTTIAASVGLDLASFGTPTLAGVGGLVSTAGTLDRVLLS